MVDISSVAVSRSEDDVVVSGQIRMPGREGEAWFRLPAGSLTDDDAAVDAFFIIGLILAMGSDGSLRMEHEVSRRLLYNARPAQDILLSWYPKKLVPVQVDVPVRAKDKLPLLEKTVTCFTGGVDSFDTLIRNEDDIDALLYVHGFDVPLSRTEIREVTSQHLQEVAVATGKELVEVSTNIRQFLNLAGKWPTITHGAALSAVGHLLSGRFGRQMLPATHTYADSLAWGSHPLLDHLWSSDRFFTVHDGAGSTRVEKTRGLANYPAARHHLRVCWQNTGKYNCGVCDKCVRTKTALYLTGVLSEFETFESELPVSAIRNLKITGVNGLSFVLENLAYAEEQGVTEIADALRSMVDDYESRKQAKAEGSSRRTLEHRVSKLEDSLKLAKRSAMAAEDDVHKLRSVLPIRIWLRFSNWRHRTAKI